MTLHKGWKNQKYLQLKPRFHSKPAAFWVLLPKESHRLAWTPWHHDCSVCLKHSVVSLSFKWKNLGAHWASGKEVGERQGRSNTLEGCIEQEKQKVFPWKTPSLVTAGNSKPSKWRKMQCFKKAVNLYKFFSKTPNTHPFPTCKTGIWFLAPTQLFLKQQAQVENLHHFNKGGGSNPIGTESRSPRDNGDPSSWKALAVERLPDFQNNTCRRDMMQRRHVLPWILASQTHEMLHKEWNDLKSSKLNYRYSPSWSTLLIVIHG